MAKINTEKEYEAIAARIEELLPLVREDTPEEDHSLIELNILSDLVGDYEDEHYPVKTPSLPDTLKLRMLEMGLNQQSLSDMLGISQSRVSEILCGKVEPTLKTAKQIVSKLGIDPCVVLGL